MKYYEAVFPYGATFSNDTVLEEFQNIHLEADEWPPKVMELGPVYVVIDEIRTIFEEVGVTGVRYIQCQVSKSWQYHDLPQEDDPNDDREFPQYVVLNIFGEPRRDDFGIERSNGLIVSERIVRILEPFEIEDLQFEEIR